MEEKKKLTWNDVYNRSFFFNAIPLAGLGGKDLAAVILLQVDYGKAIESFNGRMSDALKKIKEEKYPKFDEESQKDEKDRCPEYKEWEEELNKVFSEMRRENAAKEVEGAVLAKFTAAMFTALCGTGTDGEVTLRPGEEDSKMSKLDFLRIIAAFVED